jgi:two-component system sensor histidine kinase/response regulator
MEAVPRKKYTILVVDDIESDVDILVESLSDLYRVRVSMDGAGALEDISANPPDVILLDILMPGVDGYEVCRRIKQDERTKEALVIFVTALSEVVDETKGFELGAVDYITKPFNVSVIRARIKTHLELAQARKELKRQNEILQENIRLQEQVEHMTRHDLKNPLAVIMNIAQMLKMDLASPDEYEQLIQDQLKACYVMLNMINNSLDLYKMEKGAFKVKLSAVDMLPMIDRVLTGVSDMIRAGGLSVEVTVNGRPAERADGFELSCDELLFYSMMSNLVKNAVEASPPSGKVVISLVSSPQPSIVIENQGCVDPGIRDRFFDKFVTSGKKSGTGLGTYSARMIALMHGAQISYHTSDEEDKTAVSIVF